MNIENPGLMLELSGKAMAGIQSWSTATVAGVRDAVLNGGFIMLPRQKNVTDRDKGILTTIRDAVTVAVKAGRLFDLGHLPNEVIKTESKRGNELYNLGHIGHPFRLSYVLFHTWEAGATCYLVLPPVKDNEVNKGAFYITEFAPMILGNKRMLLMRDIIEVWSATKDREQGWSGRLYPSVLHDMAKEKGLELNEGPNDWGCNLTDPVASCLLLLATDGIAVDKVEADVKLNKARIKSGKPIIPPYWKVHAGPYVTALTQRGKPRSTPGDGHHASPTPHIRRGHLRRLHVKHGGGTTWIRDAVVNLKSPNDPVLRSFYTVQKEKEQNETRNG